MYKKKQFLAMCLAGLCSTTTVANVYNVTAMAATAASQAAENSAAASDAQSDGQTNPGGNPPSGNPGETPPAKPDGDSGNPQNGGGNPPSGENGKPGTPPDGQGGPNTQSYDYSGTLSGKLTADGEEVSSDNETISTTSADENATYGGTIIADDMTIQTAGDHSASLETDRGGGNISVTNSTLNTSGSGSPLIYSTGAIEVSGVTGTAEGSQIAGMEGLNHIKIYDSELSSTITDKTASDPVANGVIIYQSTSGDADTSTGERAQFQAVDSTLHSKIESGAMFYVTNTSADILLSGTTLDFGSTKAKLLQIEGNDANNWGRAGANGADVSFTGLGETLTGDISVDSISSLDLYLLDGTTYTGQILSTANAGSSNADGDAKQHGDAAAKGADGQSSDQPAGQDANVTGQSTGVDSTSDAGAATITVNLDQDSTWVVTGDTTVFALNAEDGAQIVDEDGKTVTIIADGTTVVKGDSDRTLTVTGSYSQNVTTSEANSISATTIDRNDFDDYYGTDTAFGTNGLNASTTTEDKADASALESPVDTQLVPSTEAAEASTQQSTAPWAVAGVIIIAALAGISAYLRKRK